MLNKKISSSLGIGIMVILLLGILIITFFFIEEISTDSIYKRVITRATDLKDIKQFSSQEEFTKYLSQAMDLSETYYQSGFTTSRTGVISESIDISFDMDFALDAPIASSEKIAPDRYSETNVQVAGIDEPDIVKTDGINIYSSLEDIYYHRSNTNTKIVQAFPVENLSLIKEIDKNGKMLLREDILVIFTNDKILGYDVADTKNPGLKWEIKVDSRTQVTAARLYQNTIYLIISNRVNRQQPCIIEPLIINEKPFEVVCTNIYYPGRVIPADTVYTLLTVDLLTGEKDQEISFIGSNSNSILYMSLDNLYLSYFEQTQFIEFMLGFLKERCSDIISKDIIERLEKLNEYDITVQSKINEMEIILDEFFYSLSENEQMRIENEINNRMPKYYQENSRDLESTEIIKIALENLEIRALGKVPGTLLNQFALDEYDGNLRVATTIGENLWGRMGRNMPGIESANDVYVLDKDLNQIGAVKDLGLDERIYSVRFLQDKGYVVTFREIDPFYILDLSDPYNPEMKGELKIPGYSSYLHPVGEHRILGIGRENWSVKVSLFDVEDPYDPKEIDKYFLNDSWSEILNNHHAFLLDAKHGIFFLPGNQGGYIFSFENDEFKLIKAIKQNQVKRALYIDDYFYIISRDNIIVLDQNNWEIIKELSF